MVDFFVQDKFNQSDRCTFKIDVIDSEPPRVLYCPEDLLVNTFRRDNNAYVTWPEPEWADNVEVANVSASSEPGFYPIGTDLRKNLNIICYILCIKTSIFHP